MAKPKPIKVIVIDPRDRTITEREVAEEDFDTVIEGSPEHGCLTDKDDIWCNGNAMFNAETAAFVYTDPASGRATIPFIGPCILCSHRTWNAASVKLTVETVKARVQWGAMTLPQKQQFLRDHQPIVLNMSVDESGQLQLTE